MKSAVHIGKMPVCVSSGMFFETTSQLHSKLSDVTILFVELGTFLTLASQSTAEVLHA
jgi:hypothetical protein